jgi:hypothetical protein
MTLAQAVQNRRHCRRKPPRQAIKVQCRRGSFGFGVNMADSFLDVSEGGVRIVVKAALDIGQDVEIRLEGLNTRPVIRVAKVVWSLPLQNGNHCIGVHFEKPLAYADLQRLAKP